MCNCTIKPLIINFRNQEMEAFNELYGIYKKLISFYAKKLGYDDALQELTLFLIELFYKIDIDLFLSDNSYSLQRYIAVAIRNYYIAISKQSQQYLKRCNELQDYIASFECDNDDKISLAEGMKRLSERQKKILSYRYFYDYSDAEIADILLISRQAVNRIRNRGLDILRAYYCGTEEI